MKKKISSVLLICLVVLLLLFVSVAGAFSIGEKIVLAHFDSHSEIYCKVPGLWEGYVPQGDGDVTGDCVRRSCGFMNNGKPSRIYVIPDDGSKAEYVELFFQDGSAYAEHTGGIAVYGDTVLTFKVF